MIISSDLGDNIALHNVGYLSHYIIGNESMLFNIEEMETSYRAKFGNGMVKDGEEPDHRVWIEDLVMKTEAVKLCHLMEC